jgi:hypothetical protein
MSRLDNPATSIGQGRKTVAAAGTEEPLVAASVAIRSLVVTAETDNTNPVTVGGNGVVGALATRQGTPLAAGESISLDIDDLAKVYVDVITNGEGVTYTYTA